tara:strand:+ start:265 stop:681 length:417 start_codon:yes stop_codon:yes gene_type:complete
MAYSCGYPDTMNKKISPLKVIDPRKKGKKYKTGSDIDETDHENQSYKTTNKDIKGSDYNVQNISSIQEDKKGQYMTSMDEDRRDKSSKTVSNYNQGRNATRDTLRPKKGKYFKQGWGEDDRNPTGKNWIKKNKKQMKS